LEGGTENFYNLKLHGEYRNRTRNRKWDILLKGEFYLNGFNTGRDRSVAEARGFGKYQYPGLYGSKTQKQKWNK